MTIASVVFLIDSACSVEGCIVGSCSSCLKCFSVSSRKTRLAETPTASDGPNVEIAETLTLQECANRLT
jgi:hypothetical protein